MQKTPLQTGLEALNNLRLSIDDASSDTAHERYAGLPQEGVAMLVGEIGKLYTLEEGTPLTEVEYLLWASAGISFLQSVTQIVFELGYALALADAKTPPGERLI